MTSENSDAELWHGVYLISFSNGCHKVGYSSDLQERVAAHARTAMNFRITVDEVHLQVIGTESDARAVEASLIRAFGLVAKGVEAAEYFYGLTGRRARNLFAKVCAAKGGSSVAVQKPVNEVAVVAAYARSRVSAARGTGAPARPGRGDLSAISDRDAPLVGDARTEWSVRYSPTSYSLPTTEAHARNRLSPGTGLVCRIVGPWTEITE